MVVHNIRTRDEFNEALKKPAAVIDAFAVWCGPCKVISPHLVQLSNHESNKDIFYAKLDVDELPDVARELGIKAMPTFLYFKDGEKVKELTGANLAKLHQFNDELRELVAVKVDNETAAGEDSKPAETAAEVAEPGKEAPKAAATDAAPVANAAGEAPKAE